MINPIRRMKKALAELLMAESDLNTVKGRDAAEIRRKQLMQSHFLEVKKAAFEKAQKRVKRERSRQKLRDLGLWTDY